MDTERTNIVPLTTNFNGGEYKSNENPLSNPPIWKRQPISICYVDQGIKDRQLQIDTKTHGLSFEQQILLSEVIMMLPYIQNKKEIPQVIKEYVKQNELTGITEAITDGVVSSTIRSWNPKSGDQMAYGTQLVHMLSDGITGKDGVEGIFDLAQNDPRYLPELRRRQVEMADQLELNEATATGLMQTHVKVQFSLFPQDMDKKTAAKLGYFVDEQVGMIRMFKQDRFGNTVTTQISVPGLNLDATEATINQLECVEGSIVKREVDYSRQTNVLGTQIFIPKQLLARGIVDIVQLYDKQQEKTTNTPHFLGKPESTNQKRNYDLLHAKTDEANEGLQNAVNSLVSFDQQLAISLVNKTPTQFITASINSFLATSERLKLTNKDVNLLNSNLVTLTPQGAALIKKLETIKVYAFASSVVNSEKAATIFKGDIAQIQQAYRKNVLYEVDPELLGNVLANSEAFFRCGLELSTYQQLETNFIGSPMSNIKAMFFGSSFEKKTLCCTCPFCKKEVEAEIYDGKIHCPPNPKGCGKSANWKD